MTFANLLKKHRRQAGWTQDRLATEAGLHKGSIAHYELGTRWPTWDAVQQLALALGVPVTEFATVKPRKRKVKLKKK